MAVQPTAPNTSAMSQIQPTVAPTNLNPTGQFTSQLGMDPSAGYSTAAQGAFNAQAQATNLSNLQWQRQMQGLQQATGYTNQMQSLYNSLYGGGGGQAAPGGMQAIPQGRGGAPGSDMLLGPPGGLPPSNPANAVSSDAYANPNKADFMPGASLSQFNKGNYKNALVDAEDPILHGVTSWLGKHL